MQGMDCHGSALGWKKNGTLEITFHQINLTKCHFTILYKMLYMPGWYIGVDIVGYLQLPVF